MATKPVYNRTPNQIKERKIGDINSKGFMNISGQIVEKTPEKYTEKSGERLYFTKLKLHDGTGEMEVVFWKNFSKESKSFQVGDWVKITYVNVKYNDYNKAMGGSYSYRSTIKISDHSKIEVKRKEKELVQMKNVSMNGVLKTKPVPKELKIPLDLNGSIWTFELEQEEVLYLVTAIKSEFDEIMSILEEGNNIKMDGVNLKDSKNVKYRYEIYVTSKSDFRVIID